MPHRADSASARAVVRVVALTCACWCLAACADPAPPRDPGALAIAPGHTVFVDTTTAAAPVRVASTAIPAPPGPAPGPCATNWSAIAPPQALMPSGARPFDHAGLSVALAGSWLLAGADGDDRAGTDAGAVHLFHDEGEDGWRHAGHVVAPDALPGDQLGWAVAAHGDVAAFGAPGRGAGVVWTFRRGDCTWLPRVAITGAALGVTAEFGAAVATDGQRLLVGAPGAAAARIYVTHPATGWVMEAALAFAGAPTPASRFGAAVAIRGDVAVLGAPDADAALVFERTDDAWALAATLTASSAGVDAGFGAAVTISDGVVVVGADDASPDGVAGAGAAYVFVRTTSGWASSARLVAPDPVPSAHFGGSVHAAGAAIAIGAWEGADGAGVAYLFEHTKAGWLTRAQLTDPHGADGDRLGLAVTLDGTRLGVGAWSADATERDAGKVLVFEAPGSCDSGANTISEACLP